MVKAPNDGYNPKRCSELLDSAAEGFTPHATAGMMGVSWATMKKWRDTYPEFAEAFETAEALLVAHHEAKLDNPAIETHTAAKCKRLLENLAPDYHAPKATPANNITISLVSVLREIESQTKTINNVSYIEAAE